MPEILPDFSEVVEIAKGSYHARLAGVLSKQSQKGDHMLQWELVIVDNADPRLNGKKLKYTTMTSGPGARNFKQLVRATINPTYDGGSVDTDNLLGKIIEIVVKDGKDKEGHPTGFPEVATVSRVKEQAQAG
jgi:hypothetical protein